MAHEPIPDKITSQWKSPPAGYRERNQKLVLSLESEFAQPPTGETLPVWRLLAEMLEVFGDHRVTLSASPLDGRVHAHDLPWRSRQSWIIALTAPLSWFSSERNWRPLEPIWDSYWTLKASRGGGRSRHDVWHLFFENYRHRNCELRLTLRTMHLGDLAHYQNIVDRFFEASDAGGCYYGRGDLAEADDLYTDPFERFDWIDVWHMAPRARKPIVPGVHRINFLGPRHLERLGGLQSLLGVERRLEGWTKTTLLGSGALVQTWVPKHLSAFDFDGSPMLQRTCTHRMWLLALFARHDMLAVQHMDWIDAEVKRIEEFQKRPQTPPTRPRRPSNEAMCRRMKSRPPSCIAACAGPGVLGSVLGSEDTASSASPASR